MISSRLVKSFVIFSVLIMGSGVITAAEKRKEVELGNIERQKVQKKGKEESKSRFTRGQALL